MTKRDPRPALRLPAYPRSAAYDPEWMFEAGMGPNSLWLTEALCEGLELAPGMRVLDLGCGRAASSIFLAREFDVRVRLGRPGRPSKPARPNGDWRRRTDGMLVPNILLTPALAPATG